MVTLTMMIHQLRVEGRLSMLRSPRFSDVTDVQPYPPGR
jgi:hypothetical protein